KAAARARHRRSWRSARALASSTSACSNVAPQRTTLTLLADALDLTASERATWDGAVLLAPTTAPDRRRGREGTYSLPIGTFLGALPSGPLVGRDTERERIGGALEAVAQGQGRLLVLVGEPGVGKTRLAQEIVVLARGRLPASHRTLLRTAA